MVFSRADVTDPGDLLEIVRTRWPREWRDAFAEREAIMAIDARFPWAVAIREAFKDCERARRLLGPSGDSPPPPIHGDEGGPR